MHLTRIAETFFNQPLMLTESAANSVEAYLWGRICAVEQGIDLQSLARPTPPQQRDRAPYAVDQGIAMIGVDGEPVNRGGLMQAASGITSYDGLMSLLQAADADAAVNGVLMEHNSPGGSVAGLSAVAQVISRMSKPVWAIANASAGSASYYLAASAARIGIVPDGMAGSIGALIVLRDMTKAMEKQGISAQVIRSGDKKARFSGIESIDATQIERAQTLVNAANDQFVAHLVNVRGMNEKKVRALQGEMLTASEAKAAGLVDNIASVHDLHLAMVAAMRKGWPTRGTASAPAKSVTATSPLLKGSTMEFIHTAADLATARAEAKAEGITEGKALGAADQLAAGASAERTRVAAILGCDEAKGRTALATHLAIKTSASIDDAKGMLAVAALETPTAKAAIAEPPKSLLAAAMNTVPNPPVGASIDEPGANGGAVALTDQQKAAAQVAQVQAQFAKPATK